MANKKRLSFIIALALLAIIPACAQRSSSSEHSFHKAVEAYYEDDDQNKALELVNKILDDNPDHLDARYLRSNIYWNNDKYDAAIRDVTYAIKNYKGEPDVYKSTLYGLRGAIYSDLERHADAAKDYQMAAKLARKDNPEHVQSYAFDYAQALYNNDDLAGLTSAAAFALDEIMPPYCFMTVLYASGSRELDSSHFRRGRVDSPNMFPR